MESDEQSPRGRRIATRTDMGLKRQRNEDFLGVQETPHGMLLVVCDGMGGHQGGDRASRLAVETFIQAVAEGSGSRDQILRSAVDAANRAVTEDAARPTGKPGMGTTLVAALADGISATVINVGDSRAYHLHGGRLARVTRDHSLVGEMVAQGRLTEEDARIHPQRNVITRALGSRLQVEGDLFDLVLADGDRLLLATDGLHGLVPDESIERILLEGGSPERCCDLLVEAALAAGGDDNVTVALLAVGADALAAAPFISPDTGPSTKTAGPTAAVAGTIPAAAPAAEAATPGPIRKRSSWLLPLVLVTVGVGIWYFQRDTVTVPPDGPRVDSLLHSATDSSGELYQMIDTGTAPADPQFDSLIRYHTGESTGAARQNPLRTDTLAGHDSVPASEVVTGRQSGARRRR